MYLIFRKIRPCPSINPGCISTNPKSSSFAFPLTIPENSSDNVIQVGRLGTYAELLTKPCTLSWSETCLTMTLCIFRLSSLELFMMLKFTCFEIVQKLQEAILETQKNAKIKILEDTPDGNLAQNWS